MAEQDTIKLLRECDAGIKMGISSMEEVLEYVHDAKLYRCLSECMKKHEKLQEEIRKILQKYQDEGKEPGAVAKGMSWVKTNIRLVMNESDKTIADLITDGCNMGVKSLERYLNQYPAAEANVKEIAKNLIHLEEKLAKDMRAYL
ncbi:MAG: hypothetical protein KHZ72_14175 [Lachnospiraceae bacterium]|nr:hypothetical protein [Lachnospiraceae bacterium]